jgi:hypothetical protein
LRKPGASFEASRKGRYSGGPQAMDLPAGPLFVQAFRDTPVAAVVESVQHLEIGSQKGVAPPKRPDLCFFEIVRSDPHGAQIRPLWLTSSCERRREAPLQL